MYTDDPKLAIREAPGLNVAIAKGWSVAIPDHLGPSSAYGAAKLGGQITLDGIRTAGRFDALGLGSSPVGMAGYSGGAMATAMAAAIAPTYALKTRARGQRLRRRSDEHRQHEPRALVQQKHPAFGLAMAAALGLEHQYPDRMPITSQLNTAGQQLRDQIANACTNQIMLYGVGRSLADVADRRCRHGATRQREHSGRVRRQQRRKRIFGSQCPCVRVAFEEPMS